MATEPLTRISIAAHLIGDEKRPLWPQSLSKSAKKAGFLTRDGSGRLAIPTSRIAKLRELYRTAGVLVPRGNAEGGAG